MPINTTPGSNPSASALANDTSAAPSKSGKAKSPRSPRRTGAAPKRSRAVPETSSSAEIVFTELPNPYHKTPPPFIWIDHPEEQERLSGPVYVVRMGIGGAVQAEISIDGGVWQPCRLTSGYWWYDWSGIQPGRHTLTARMKTSDGRWYRTPPRSCERRP